MTTDHPAGATLHLGGEAWAHPGLEATGAEMHHATGLIPFPGNPRRGDQDAITASLREVGLYRALIVQTSTLHVLAGNHTLRGLLDLGATRVPVTWVDVDDTRAAQIVARDNRTSDRGGYDDTEQLALLEALAAQDELPGSGYTADDLDALRDVAAAAREPVASIEDAPPPPATPVTQEGDVWVLGRHRLMCGSGLDEEHLTGLLDGVVPDLVYTDPPYGIAIVKGQAADGQGKVGHALGTPTGFGKVGGSRPVVKTRWYAPVIGDETTATAVSALHLSMRLYPKALQVWWGANHYAGDAALPNASCWLVWDKQTGANTFADAELAWTNGKGSARLLSHQWNGLLRASERGARVHPTQKPVALAVWAFSTMLKKPRGKVILDQFGGSGSALIAAEQAGALARIMELSPAYCDVMCRRYQEQTGSFPVRDGVQVDFTQVLAAAHDGPEVLAPDQPVEDQ